MYVPTLNGRARSKIPETTRPYFLQFEDEALFVTEGTSDEGENSQLIPV